MLPVCIRTVSVPPELKVATYVINLKSGRVCADMLATTIIDHDAMFIVCTVLAHFLTVTIIVEGRGGKALKIKDDVSPRCFGKSAKVMVLQT